MDLYCLLIFKIGQESVLIMMYHVKYIVVTLDLFINHHVHMKLRLSDAMPSPKTSLDK